MRLLLLNPNTNPATTEAMLALAREAAPAGAVIEGSTAGFGVPLITDAAALAVAADAVAALAANMRLDAFDGVIVAAFGDPGLHRLRALVTVPVTGIAEAGMAEAARLGPFMVVTTTPALVGAITRTASAYGHGDRFRGVRLTMGEPNEVMANETRLLTRLEAACRDAARDRTIASIVIGGGPLAAAARALRDKLPIALIEPVPAAVRLAAARAEARQRRPLGR